MPHGHRNPDAILEVNGLTVTYTTPDTSFTAVKNITFTVRNGEILGIVGESGAGKTTIRSAITQLIDHPGRITSGSIRLLGEELVGKSEKGLCSIRAREIGTIFQEPSIALSPVLSIGQQLQRAIYLSTGIRHGKALHDRAIELIRLVGITEPERRLRQFPYQLSGGMQQRVVIAMALSGEPSLLIADEPTTALDVSIQAEILELMNQLRHGRDMGVILITHDMAVVSEVTDRVAIMLDGQIVEMNDTNTVINSPMHPYTQSLICAVPRTDVKLARFKTPSSAEADAHDSRKNPFELDWRSDRGGNGIPRPLIRLEGIRKQYVIKKALLRGNTKYLTALNEVAFSIEHGDVFGLVGESGSGKSTIAKILCGLETPDSGSVFYKGIDITGLRNSPSLRSLSAGIQMVFQDPHSSLNPRHRIFDILAEPLRIRRRMKPDDIRMLVKAILDKVGLKHESGDKFPHQFSGGQRQRICIARALVMQPLLLICDEPTSSLDVAIQAEILNLLKQLQEDLSLTILFVSHNLAVIRQMCNKVAVLKDGQICEVSDANSLFEAPQHEYTRTLLDRMPNFTTTYMP